MKLTLILGPMKSSKSLDLIRFFSPLKHSKTKFACYQPLKNERDKAIESRTGLVLDSQKISTLRGIQDLDVTKIGIDEIHMFDPNDVVYVERTLGSGIEVVISGLDMDYRGKMFPIVQGLLELGPDEVRYKRAVCNVCKEYCATNTQVYFKGVPVTEGLPSVLPEDGTYGYEPVCRKCFVRK